MKQASFRNSNRFSPLDQAQSMKLGREGGHGKKHRDLAVALPLTSLIDAFCIIVIYLLIGTQSGGLEINMPSKIQLPTAEAGQSIEKETSIVRVENGRYFLNDEAVSIAELGPRLAKLKAGSEEMEIMIQGDQKMNYVDLDPILKAGSSAGIQKLKFAVMPTK